METLHTILLILIFILFVVIGYKIIAFYLAGEILKAIFWILILILLSENGDKKNGDKKNEDKKK